MDRRSLLVIILAAGEGKRMRSARPKVMHELAGLPMLGHVLRAAEEAGGRMAVVIGPGHDETRRFLEGAAADAAIDVQVERRGTAHATLAARARVAEGFDDVVIAFGDTPLLTGATLERLRAPLAEGAAVVVAGMRVVDPTGYGRLLMDGDRLLAIREHRDASPEERGITLCNGGVMAVAGERLLGLLDRVRADNAQGEFYLTDIVALANADSADVRVAHVDASEVLGVNTRLDLAAVEETFQRRRRRAAIEAEGARLIAPDTVFFSHDTRLGEDATVEPYVVFGAGVSVGAGAVIHAFSHLEGAAVAPGASIGPFARLRPGARIGAKARVGNFVEVKNAVLGEGAKANHLSYLGDAEVGATANVGAGTITCNYDGVNKARTVIGAGAFIGSNSSLVAPIRIGDGAYVASGSVLTEDVEAEALAFGRARQVVKPGRAARLRKGKTATPGDKG